jgi:hypothetical protein
LFTFLLGLLVLYSCRSISLLILSCIRWFHKERGLLEHEGSVSSFESRRKIHVSWNDTSIEQAKHTILDVILCNWRRVSKRIISKVLWKDSLRLCNFLLPDVTDSKSLQIRLADSSLRSSILYLVRLR